MIRPQIPGVYYYYYYYYWGETESFGTVGPTGLLYQPQMIGDGDCGEIGGMKIGRGTIVLGKNCPCATLSTTNSI
jgi:hypothetical protein